MVPGERSNPGYRVVASTLEEVETSFIVEREATWDELVQQCYDLGCLESLNFVPLHRYYKVLVD
jgi:hypothetical protein